MKTRSTIISWVHLKIINLFLQIWNTIKAQYQNINYIYLDELLIRNKFDIIFQLLQFRHDLTFSCKLFIFNLSYLTTRTSKEAKHVQFNWNFHLLLIVFSTSCFECLKFSGLHRYYISWTIHSYTYNSSLLIIKY